MIFEWHNKRVVRTLEPDYFGRKFTLTLDRPLFLRGFAVRGIPMTNKHRNCEIMIMNYDTACFSLRVKQAVRTMTVPKHHNQATMIIYPKSRGYHYVR
ncbi:hypothetical protein D6T31_23445 [Salmonella enterica subsp. enterica]|nr:hypothetical protein [Salmonella enterica subsp. enterica serovar Enteritidis]